MALPTTREGLTDAGYVYDNDGVCRSCQAPIEWWVTPHDKKMPFTVREVKKDESNFLSPPTHLERVPHHMTCPQGREWRRK